ncbi:hypothetical protein QBC40DRAFT_170522 [Triangularia verruculosa]|uniref:Uncharacterized protein n=1 Tax=Triangularia verruculosa TaxID=2587418 RepID=A0AAN6XJE0_9PEZI|nr:hypothetical protein QBC40DRAFT_170522 [Triangularia verruculosa]
MSPDYPSCKLPTSSIGPKIAVCRVANSKNLSPCSLSSRHDARGSRHNPANLQKLPFTMEGFQQIAATLPLHGDTARIINRSDMPVFEEIDLFSTKGDKIYYCCRTSGAWPGDLAISSVFDPKTGLTSGVVFGCSDDVTEDIAGRIENSENAWTHPMLSVGILVEIERSRHMKLVQDRLFELLQHVQKMTQSQEILPTSQLVHENYSVELWIKVSQLKLGLIAWRSQLANMDAHILELEEIVLLGLSEEDKLNTLLSSMDMDNSTDSGKSFHLGKLASHTKSQFFSGPKSETEWRVGAREEGRRIQKRLKEIISEYDCKIRECSMVLDGVSLSAQLSWNQIGFQDTRTNLKIAAATRQDGNQMRMIAFLTMIFLPATFLASVFSMTFFNWDAPEGEQIVSPYVWIYPVVVIGVTAVVIGTWYYLTKRRCSSGKKWDHQELV